VFLFGVSVLLILFGVVVVVVVVVIFEDVLMIARFTGIILSKAKASAIGIAVVSLASINMNSSVRIVSIPCFLRYPDVLHKVVFAVDILSWVIKNIMAHPLRRQGYLSIL